MQAINQMPQTYQSIKLSPLLRIDELYTLHYFEFADTFSFPGEKHAFWELAYIDRGEAGIMLDDTGYLLKSGDAIFYPPNTYHSIWANGQFTNAASVAFSTRSLCMEQFKSQVFKLSPQEKNLLAALLREGRQAFSEPLDLVDLKGHTLSEQAAAGSLQMIQLLLEQLLLSLLRHPGNEQKECPQPDDSRHQHEQIIVDQINQFLADHIQEKITLDDVCAELLFSRTYLKSIYKKRTGDSIMHHFLVMKIDEAKRLISKQQFTFSEIAQQLNFCSVHHFSRTFSRIARLTPREYARSVQSRGVL